MVNTKKLLLIFATAFPLLFSSYLALASGEGEVGNFTGGTPLPAPRYLHSSIFANDYIYVLGGRNIYDDGTVFYSKFNADGSNSAWKTTTGLPMPFEEGSAVLANEYVYFLGGYSSGAQSGVYYAKLNSDGTFGSWETSPSSLPDVRFRHSSVFANGYIYVIGGTSYYSPAKSTIFYAKANSDGSIGPWQSNANSLPFPGLRNHSSVVANGYVYAIGGFDGGNWRTEVYYAKLNSDGSTGPWQTNANNLPIGLYSQSAVVDNGYVYVLGGYTRMGPQATVYSAKLNSDGSTEPWQTNPDSLPAAIFGHTSFVANGNVYTIGGGTGGGNAQNYVYSGKLPELDHDKDGVADKNDDLCLDSISDVDPKVNHYSWKGGEFFQTLDPKSKTLVDSGYSIADTRGCTCSQILEKNAGKRGDTKDGCSQATMAKFIQDNAASSGFLSDFLKKIKDLFFFWL